MDADGWFYSGDIGYIDEEGFLFIVDRLKELLKYNNHQISPSEIEGFINEIDGVVSSCVVGVTNDIGNDILVAFVKRSKEKVTEPFIIGYIEGIEVV